MYIDNADSDQALDSRSRYSCVPLSVILSNSHNTKQLVFGSWPGDACAVADIRNRAATWAKHRGRAMRISRKGDFDAGQDVQDNRGGGRVRRQRPAGGASRNNQSTR